MRSPSASSEQDLTDHIELLRQEVQVLRNVIDEFHDNLVPAVRNLADVLRSDDFSGLRLPDPTQPKMLVSGDNGQADRFLPVDFRELKSRVSIIEVLELMDWRPVKKSAGQLRGPCPVHCSTSENSQTFVVTPSKNAWKCFKCDSGGNQLDLAASYFKIDATNIVWVAVQLCEQLGIEVPRKHERSTRG